MRGIVISFAAVAATLAVAAPAGAAADRSIALSGAAPKIEWDGAAGNGVPTGYVASGLPTDQACGSQAHTCDTTLINVKDAGTLVVSPAAAANAPDVDIALYRSDAAGTQGDEVQVSNNTFTPDRIATDVDPGYYLAVVDYAAAFQGGYHAVATLTTSAVEFSPGAPERHTTLTAAKPEFKFSGTGSGLVFDCGELNQTLQPCDHTLVHLTKPGDLAVDIKATSQANAWDYLNIYASNKAGAVGDVVGSANDVSGDESAVAGGLDAGYYLVEVGFLVTAPMSTFDGTLTYTEAEPQPAASKAKAKKRRAAAKRARARSRR